MPQPFGPTTPVMPVSIWKSDGSTNDLNPIRRRRVNCIFALARPRRELIHANLRGASGRGKPTQTLILRRFGGGQLVLSRASIAFSNVANGWAPTILMPFTKEGGVESTPNFWSARRAELPISSASFRPSDRFRSPPDSCRPGVRCAADRHRVSRSSCVAAPSWRRRAGSTCRREQRASMKPAIEALAGAVGNSRKMKRTLPVSMNFSFSFG